MGVFSDIVQLPAITGGGPTQDFTIPGFGTPKAAIFIVNGCNENNTVVEHARLSFGFTDGLSQRVVAIRSQNDVLTTDTRRTMNAFSLIRIIQSTTATLDGTARFDSMITDGIRIEWIDFPTSGNLVTCILLNGDNLSVHVSDFKIRSNVGEICEVSKITGTVTAIGAFVGGVTRITVTGTPFSNNDVGNIFIFDNTNNEYRVAAFVNSSQIDLLGDVTGESPSDTFTFDGPDFESDFLMCCSNRASIGGSISKQSAFSLGFVKNSSPIVNISQNWISRHNTGNSDPRISINSNRFIHSFLSPNVSASAEVTAFNTTGFDVTTRSNTNDIIVSYLALAFGGVIDFDTWIFDTPTTPGLFIDSGPNFKPQFMMYGMNMAGSIDTTISNVDAGSIGISTFTANKAFSNAITDEDASNPTNTSSVCSGIPVLLPSGDGASGFLVTSLPSMTDTGPELNWDSVSSTPRKWIAFGFTEFASIHSSHGKPIDWLLKTSDHNPQLIGTFTSFVSGVNIEVWDVTDGANVTMLIPNSGCYQIGNTGRWGWSTINLPPTQGYARHYFYLMTSNLSTTFDGQFILDLPEGAKWIHPSDSGNYLVG